jgi:hypothetical protein
MKTESSKRFAKRIGASVDTVKRWCENPPKGMTRVMPSSWGKRGIQRVRMIPIEQGLAWFAEYQKSNPRIAS